MRHLIRCFFLPMLRSAWLGIVLSVAVVSSGVAQEAATPDSLTVAEGQAAQEAADAWLVPVDSMDYRTSYQQASPLLQEQTSETQWVQTLRTTFGAMGSFISRAPQGREFRTALPGAPEGEYVIVTYNSRYTQAEDAVETVVMAKSATGEWQTAGYDVRPAP